MEILYSEEDDLPRKFHELEGPLLVKKICMHKK